jgi:hypothetical protein
VPAPTGAPLKVTVNGKEVVYGEDFAALGYGQALSAIAILTTMVIYVTMVYGPDRGGARRVLPDTHPLRRHVAAPPHRQWLV